MSAEEKVCVRLRSSAVSKKICVKGRDKVESPEYVKISQASAMSLGLMGRRMYRGAVNRCVNLLVHYPEGCSANCAYCGLAKKRPGSYKDKSFIHVTWPIYPLNEIVDAIRQAPSYVKRTCISMITNGKCAQDTLKIASRLNHETILPLSVLIQRELDKSVSRLRECLASGKARFS